MSTKVAPERVEVEAGQEMAATTTVKSSVSVDVERIEEGAGEEMTTITEVKSSVSTDVERIEAGAGEEMVAITEVKSSVSTDVEKSEEVSGKDNMPASKSPVSMDEEEMDLNIESTTVDYFDNRPLKKTKSSKTCDSDDPLSSFTISTASIVSECSDSVSSELMNEDPLPPPPNQLALSPISAEDDKHITNNLTYEYLPQDYTLTQLDECAHCVIHYSNEDDVLVKIGDISIRKRYLECLLDERKWLDDEVISGYICCLREQAQAQNQNDAKIYFENPFVSRLLKQDGERGIDGPTGMTKVVENYLEHDMIHLPINIKDSHWYFASINLQTCDIYVLDSLCWKNNRSDLTLTLQGIQHHLDILRGQGKLDNYKCKDIDITKWRIIEYLEKPIQKDSSSCGLFLLKFMEYWTGSALSHPITQEIISSFRPKLAAILLCWKNNTAPPSTMIEDNDDSSGDPNEVIMSDKPFVRHQSNDNNPVSVENKYHSLMSVLSNLSMHELVGGLCNYIKSINSPEDLEQVWVQSSQPYTISLTLKTLQGVLNNEQPMDRDCFNLVVRKIMFDDIHMAKKRRGLISKHCLDMQFWMITDFGRHPNYRKKLDVEQLTSSVCSWPGIKYSVSSCKSIHIPIQSGRDFILIILDKDTRTVYILDPTPIDPMYQRNPLAKYVHRILWIAENLPKAMSKTCPGSTWNENIFLWQQKIVHDISGHIRELSGFFVTLFMSTWEEEKVHLPFLKDGYELRKHILGQLLTIKENEYQYNMPTGVQDFINCIRNIQDNMNLKK